MALKLTVLRRENPRRHELYVNDLLIGPVKVLQGRLIEDRYVGKTVTLEIGLGRADVRFEREAAEPPDEAPEPAPLPEPEPDPEPAEAEAEPEPVLQD
jgi:hypothetical protein